MKTIALTLLVLTAGCASRSAQTRYGWFDSAVTVQDEAYAEGFQRVADHLDQVPCEKLVSTWREGRKPVIVLLHGAGGEGPEIDSAVPVLASGAPSAFYRLKWSAWDTRKPLTDRMARGISHLGRCAAESDREVVVIAHSAGGVLVSYVAHALDVPVRADGQPTVTVLTVAAPLSGAVAATPMRRPMTHFFFELGRPLEYQAAAPGVRVIHLRTSMPGDVQMAPILGHPPNDPNVGVPGAPTIDLPRSLTHSGALFYVSKLLATNELDGWLTEKIGSPRAAPSAVAGP
ncbi:MAG: hypothetical protein JNK82_24830 [Myxococcaceae bacterium]|nr:hypothetical protein [Myxococcaceae bacterium]